MSQIELSYNEFKNLIFNEKKLNYSHSYIKNSENIKYYLIVASELDGGITYITRINSTDDSDEVINYENLWSSNANKKRANDVGMDISIQYSILEYLKDIAKELNLLNKRIEYISESGWEYSDLD